MKIYTFSIRLLFLFLLLGGASSWMYAQTIDVTGKVTDPSGEALIGVTVLEQNTTNGTVTDFDGIYSLTITIGATLEVSYVGMETQTLVVSDKGTYDFVLSESAEVMDEVVVVGYSTKKKSEITGSISSISTERLEKRNLKVVGEALQGEVAGVQVTTPGRPGDEVNIRLHGYSSIPELGTFNGPLILVDGQEVGRLSTVDPNDIADITVLKDATSAAIYGNRAANGVILITTKKGKKGTASVTYNSFFGWQEPTNLVEMLNAGEYVELLNESIANANSDKRVNNPNATDTIPFRYSPEEVAFWKGQEGTNWQEEMLQTAPMQNHHLNFRGSSSNSVYSISLGYLKQDGIYRGTNFERFNFRVNGEMNIGKRLKVGQNVTFNYSNQDQGGDFYISRTFMMPPTVPVQFEDGSWGFDDKGATNNILKNPVAMSDLIRWETAQTHIFGTVYADFEFFQGLNLRSAIRLDRRLEEKDYFEQGYFIGEEGLPGSAQQVAFADVADFKDQTWDWENWLTFKCRFGDHSVGAILGTAARRHNNNFLLAKGFEFPPFVEILNAVGTTNRIIQGSNTEYTTLSYFGSLDYSFKDRYIISGIVRRDGSSRFGPNNRFGTFPSISFAWRASEESFFQGLKPYISNLKIRGGWGQLGNSSIGDYEWQSIVTFGLGYVMGGGSGSYVEGGAPVQLANPDLRWETLETIGIGMDLGLLNNRINVKADYYVRTTLDALLVLPVTAITGSNAAVRQNLATIENQGVDLELGYNDVFGPLSVSAGFNIGFIENQIKDLEGTRPILTGRETSSHIYAEGYSLRHIYGYRTLGVFQNEEQLEQLPHRDGARPGDLIFEDINGDGIINEADRTFLAPTVPDFTYGGNLNFSAYGVDVSILFQGVSGNNILLANANFGGGRGFFKIYENQVAEYKDRWHGEGTSNTIPRLVFQSDPNQNDSNSDFFIQDASYLRIKNLQIGYTFPSNWTRPLGIENLRIYGGGTNLVTWTDYTGFDPEVALEQSDSFGWDYPIAKTYIFGINVDFAVKQPE